MMPAWELRKHLDDRDASIVILGNEVTSLTARVKELEAVLRQIADAPAWGAPNRWEPTPFEVRQLAREALSPAQAAPEKGGE